MNSYEFHVFCMLLLVVIFIVNLKRGLNTGERRVEYRHLPFLHLCRKHQKCLCNRIQTFSVFSSQKVFISTVRSKFMNGNHDHKK